MQVFAFEGPHEVFAFASIDAAANYLEVIDVQNGEYELFGDDGTYLTASVDDQLVVLTPSAQKEPADLRARLQLFLSQPDVALDPILADDPSALAALLSNASGERPPLWLQRLRHRRRD